MKNEFYKTKKEIEYWLNEYKIENYILISDVKYGFIIDIDGSVNLCNFKLKWIPVKFNKVNGSFDCSQNKLMSLEFSPIEVKLDFNCNSNELTSLEFCVNKVGGNFFCNTNKLTSLEFCPEKIGNFFSCANNKIENLLYFPSEVVCKCFMDKNEKLGLMQQQDNFDILFNEHLKQIKEVANSELLKVIEENLISNNYKKSNKI